MTGKTNIVGLSEEKALAKATADATITAEKVLKNEIGYGKNGEKIVGLLELFPASKIGYVTGVTATEIAFDFVPNFFILMMEPGYSGELKTPAVFWSRSSDGTWDYTGRDSLHNYYDGSGGSNLGQIDSVTDEKATLTYLSSNIKYIYVMI